MRNLFLGLVFLGCTMPFEPETPYERITPPNSYNLWWEEVEACAAQQSDRGHVTWFLVAADSFLTPSGWASGYWSGGHEIYIAESERWSDWDVVKHEILHEILHTGDHPSPPFGVCSAKER